jgi:hypothetical protein
MPQLPSIAFKAHVLKTAGWGHVFGKNPSVRET